MKSYIILSAFFFQKLLFVLYHSSKQNRKQKQGKTNEISVHLPITSRHFAFLAPPMLSKQYFQFFTEK